MHLIGRTKSFRLLSALSEPPVTMTCWKQLDAIITAEAFEASLVCPADLQLASLEFWLELADCAISSAGLSFCCRACRFD